ncbi:hypothetical protein ACFFV7_14060 [Nonomuraea spiralis]|uniref:Uncharacterized protein n=1 Tax=Nonomuraea spiralis TaxID=46182 RepID=A0ABV5IF04_9ACTN|nr:hypothetical protein [Nonomuraea spiralis]
MIEGLAVIRLSPFKLFAVSLKARGRCWPRPAEEPQRGQRPPDTRRAAAGGTPLTLWRSLSPRLLAVARTSLGITHDQLADPDQPSDVRSAFTTS